MFKKSLFIFLSAFALLSPGFAQEPQAPIIHLLGLDDGAFPKIEAYVSVIDPQRPVPVKGLTFTNFSAVASNGQTLQVQAVSEEHRPLHVVIIVDLTSSVSEEELFYQKLAVQKLLEPLQSDDQIALLTLNPQSVTAVTPLLSDHDAIIAGLESLATNPDIGGNTFWDALYSATVMLQENPAAARQVVILITDLARGTAEG